MQSIRNNFTLKVLAFALAVLGWAYFRFAGGSGLADGAPTQQLSVPIAAVGLLGDYVAHYTDRQAVVTVNVKRGDPPVKPEEIKAVLDLSNKGAGVYNVPITLVAPSLAVGSLSPASVTLTIEKVETRVLPATLHYLGNRSSTIVVAASNLLPAGVTLNGPTSALEQVVAVNLDLAFPNEPKTLDEMLRPVAVNAAGEEVSGVTIAPDLVRARIRFAAGSSTGKP